MGETLAWDFLTYCSPNFFLGFIFKLLVALSSIVAKVLTLLLCLPPLPKMGAFKFIAYSLLFHHPQFTMLHWPGSLVDVFAGRIGVDVFAG